LSCGVMPPTQWTLQNILSVATIFLTVVMALVNASYTLHKLLSAAGWGCLLHIMFLDGWIE